MRYPDFSYEKRLWRKGFRFVVGLDEVGRGAFAGPVTVGAVVFGQKEVNGLDGLNDSKLLKPRFREKLARVIKKEVLAWTVASTNVTMINRFGIGKATQMTMRKAIESLKERGIGPDFVLVDAFYIPYLRGLRRKNQQALKKGDQKSFSIAAASILAKVSRDRLMRSLSRQPQYQAYGWGKNKGYGTLSHRQAIQKLGLTRLHRQAFVHE